MRDLERRLDVLERANTRTPQVAHVGLTGSPLVGGITTNTATVISGMTVTVEVPVLATVVLVSATTELAASTAASATVRIGLEEATDFPAANKHPLMEAVVDNTMPLPSRIFTGTELEQPTTNNGANVKSFQEAHFLNPYGKFGAEQAPTTPEPTPGTRTYRLTRWREAGTGTGQVWSAYLWVIVL
jgi:hypothetical protein